MNATLYSRLLLLASCAAITLSACSGNQENESAAGAMKASTALEGSLDILALPGHVESGQTEQEFDWVSGFEAKTGCRVNVKTVANSAAMLALVTNGGPRPDPPGDAPFDLVIASGDVALKLIRDRIVMPVDIARVPSYAGIDERLQQAPWHFVDGKHHGVPWQWGPNLLLYNTETFKTAPGSWSVVFEEQRFPDGRPNKGRVQAYERPIYIADAALYLKAKRPELGIKDPYELDETQYAAVLETLRGQKRLVQRYWHDPSVQVQDFLNEGVKASGSTAFQASTLLMNKAKVATTVPAEGATGWADTTMLVTGARHPNCAYQWLEWSLSPKVQGDVAAWVGSNPVVPKACEGNALLGPDGCRKNGIETFDKLSFWRTPEAKCASNPAGCVPYARWVSDYSAVMQGK